MAIHILTTETYPLSACGINLSTKEHSFMFGVVDLGIKNICTDCKEKYASVSHGDESCAIVKTDQLIEQIQQGPL